MTLAQRANHCVVVDGTETHHLMPRYIRNEDFPRRGNCDTGRKRQRAGESRQLTNPGAVRGPQHCYSKTVGICHEEEGLVGAQCQAARHVELARLIASRANGALPRALHLKHR